MGQKSSLPLQQRTPTQTTDNTEGQQDAALTLVPTPTTPQLPAAVPLSPAQPQPPTPPTNNIATQEPISPTSTTVAPSQAQTTPPYPMAPSVTTTSTTAAPYQAYNTPPYPTAPSMTTTSTPAVPYHAYTTPPYPMAPSMTTTSTPAVPYQAYTTPPYSTAPSMTTTPRTPIPMPTPYYQEPWPRIDLSVPGPPPSNPHQTPQDTLPQHRVRHPKRKWQHRYRPYNLPNHCQHHNPLLPTAAKEDYQHLQMNYFRQYLQPRQTFTANSGQH